MELESIVGVIGGARVYSVGARVYSVGARVYSVRARVYSSLVILVSPQSQLGFWI